MAMMLLELFVLLFGTAINVASARPACHEIFSVPLPPFVNQQTDYFCGPAVLQSVLESVGIAATQSQLARLAKTTPAIGTTPLNMTYALEQFGLKSKIIHLDTRTKLDTALREHHAVIALITLETEAHWILIARSNNKRYAIMDPWIANKNYRSLSPSELLAMWRAEFDGKSYEYLAIVVSRENE